MITVQLRINNVRSDRHTVELPAIPRVGEHLIYTLPADDDVWHDRTYLWTVAKVIHIPAQGTRPMSVAVILTDGMTLVEGDDE